MPYNQNTHYKAADLYVPDAHKIDWLRRIKEQRQEEERPCLELPESGGGMPEHLPELPLDEPPGIERGVVILQMTGGLDDIL